jgi:hypothetical protein
MKCVFSTDIGDNLSCSKDGEFDKYGFPIKKCEQFPCEKYNSIINKIKEWEKESTK